MADGWGMHRNIKATVLVEKKAASEEQVSLSVKAGGALHRPVAHSSDRGSLMRREEQEDVVWEHHHHKHHNNIKAMFDNMDRNGDGYVSNAEVKREMQKIDANQHVKMPEGMHSIVGKLSDDDSADGLSFEMFKAAVLHASKSDMLHDLETADEDRAEADRHHAGHRASGHKHSRQDHLELLEDTEDQPRNGEVANAEWVTCGGHKATTCALCPVTDATGTAVTNHGQEWCHGDCIWDDGSTTKDAKGVLITCFNKEGYVHSGVGAGAAVPYRQTTPVPDLLNPNITKADEATINQAAADAIKEENMEVAEAQQKEEKAQEDKKFTWSKFWLIAIIGFSVVLGICACVSVIALIVFIFMGNPGPPVEKGDDEAAALAAGEGEAEGAAADAPKEEGIAEGAAEEVATPGF